MTDTLGLPYNRNFGLPANTIMGNDTGSTGPAKALTAADVAAFLGGNVGNVTGPGSSTDNAVPRFDGTTGTTLQGSAVTIDDAGKLTATSVASNTLIDATAVKVTTNGTTLGTLFAGQADLRGLVPLYVRSAAGTGGGYMGDAGTDFRISSSTRHLILRVAGTNTGLMVQHPTGNTVVQGGLTTGNANHGFYGVTAVARPQVSGSLSTADKVDAVLAALDLLGLLEETA